MQVVSFCCLLVAKLPFFDLVCVDPFCDYLSITLFSSFRLQSHCVLCAKTFQEHQCVRLPIATVFLMFGMEARLQEGNELQSTCSNQPPPDSFLQHCDS